MQVSKPEIKSASSNTAGPVVLQALAYDPAGAAEATSFGKDEIYSALNAGELVGKKRGRRTVITADALIAWINSLPNYPSRESAAA